MDTAGSSAKAAEKEVTEAAVAEAAAAEAASVVVDAPDEGMDVVSGDMQVQSMLLNSVHRVVSSE